MKIISVRHDYPEKAGFKISRPTGRKDYTFLHFKEKMTFVINGEKVITEPGACIFFSPDEPQLFYSETTDISHNWMHFSPECKPLLEKFNLPVNQILYPTDGKFISRLFYIIETEFYSSLPFKDEILDGYLMEFFIRFSRNLSSPAVTLVNKETKICLQKIRQKVLANPKFPWTVEKMAKEINLSPSRFHTVYKATFGIAPMNDVIENRIQNAMNLLVSTNLAVTEIGELSGYTNPHHFIRQFKSQTGLTPLAYRKNSR